MSGRIVNVRPKPGFVMDAGGNVVQLRTRDGLANVVTGLGTRQDARTSRTYYAQLLGPQQIEEAFDASAMLRKAIRIPALDRVRARRDWQADQDQIELLEKEEERLDLWGKIYLAEVLRGLGGGAMILVGAGQPDQPLNVTSKQGLVAINVVSRWHLSGEDWIDDLSRADYGTPTFWKMSGTQSQQRLHPSRVVCFRAEPLPSIWRGNAEDRFWGRGRVPTLLEPAQNLDEALATFSALIKDALNVDVGVTKLLEMVATTDGEARLMRRLSLMVQGSSVFNGKLYDLGDETGKGGEKLDRHQVSWTGIPDVIRVYAEAFAAASDIPVTRLWGTSAKGLNATGDGDAANYREAIEAGRDLELKPCLKQIDDALIPSALGSKPDTVWWEFGELEVMSEKEEADVFKTTVDAMEKVQMMGIFSERAFAKGGQNTVIEGGWMPGIAAAAAEEPEDVRFGLNAEPDPNDPNADPSALQAQQAKGGDPVSPTSGSPAPAPAGRANQGGAPTNGGNPFADARKRRRKHGGASHFDPDKHPRGPGGKFKVSGNRETDISGKRVSPSGRTYADDILRGRGGSDMHQLGVPSDRAKRAIRALGLEPDHAGRAKPIVLDSSGIGHARKHVTVVDARRITADDLGAAHHVLNFGTIERGNPPTSKVGAPRITASATRDGSELFAVFEIRSRTIALQNMWAVKKVGG